MFSRNNRLNFGDNLKIAVQPRIGLDGLAMHSMRFICSPSPTLANNIARTSESIRGLLS
jgi:hypothetical protein